MHHYHSSPLWKKLPKMKLKSTRLQESEENIQYSTFSSESNPNSAVIKDTNCLSWHQVTQQGILTSFIDCFFFTACLSCFQPGVSCTTLSLQEALWQTTTLLPTSNFLCTSVTKKKKTKKGGKDTEGFHLCPKSWGGQSCMLTDESDHSRLRAWQPDGHQLVSSIKVQLPFCCLTRSRCCK